jgi:hypothetical protein
MLKTFASKSSIRMKFVLAFALISMAISAQNASHKVYPRPPVDFSSIKPDAIEPGKFRIKFKSELNGRLTKSVLSKAKSGIVTTGVSEIDALNTKFKVKEGKSLLSSVYAGNLKSTSQFESRHRKHGLNLWYEFDFDGDVDIREIIKAYGSLADVAIIEPIFKIVLIGPVAGNSKKTATNKSSVTTTAAWQPNDTRFPSQWHYNNTGQNDGTTGADIDLVNAWEYERGNSNVIVAVIDQGVDYLHPDLAANMWGPIGPEGTATQPGNHGTHVAGTIAAVTNNTTGGAGIAGGSGTGDGVRIMSLDLFGGSHGMNTLEMNVWAADNGASISQNSWGYTNPGDYNQADLDGIDYFNTYGGGNELDGGITIFAAGNDDDSGDWYPGCYPGVIAVAATNNNDQKAWYSNYATWVDISAPGGETMTASNGVLSTIASSGYDYYQGTSMACPHVSGIAALVVSQAPGVLTNTQLKEILLAAVDNHYGNNASYSGMLGSGRINALKALELTQEYLGAIRNPSSFLATANGETTINLSWQLNSDQNEVIIAVSNTGIFGTPVENQSYAVGESIEGGGAIIYKGNDLSLALENLTLNTNYHFKIWSVNSENQYSFGSSKQAKTFKSQITLSTTNLTYGLAYVGYPKTQVLLIQNIGESNLIITDVSFTNSVFSSAAIPEVIEPGDLFAWEIVLNSSSASTLAESLNFSTNDPDKATVSIALAATVSSVIPIIGVNPESLESHLFCDEENYEPLNIENTGDGTLEYSITIENY